MTDDNVVVVDEDDDKSRIVTKFLLDTCRWLQPSQHRAQAAAGCGRIATIEEQISKTHWPHEDVLDHTGVDDKVHLIPLITGSSAFWQVRLDDESARLCTFNSPFGRYSFTRLPFGITSAPEILQKRNEEAFGDIENVHIVFDDLISCSVE